MSREILLDLSFLTEDERDLINNVISKDAEVRKAEQSRISSLRKELDELKENGLSEDEVESKNENYCARCQTYFGLIWNRGAYCPRCKYKVCKVCRLNDVDDGWICTLCNKVREVKAQSGAWFFQGHKEKNGNLFGSMLVRQSLRRLPAVQPKEHKEPSNPFIEDDEANNPFTSGNHGRSTERLSGQADLNSNSAQRNGRLGSQYSDESDEEGHDGSLEDNHDDTASDRTLSKGGSESSESLDSDHDETVASIELSPVTTRELTLQAKPNAAKWGGHSGGNVEQQGLPKETEDEFGISKDTQGIRDRPPAFHQDAHQNSGNVVQKQLVRYTKSDEGTVRNTEKVRSRPGSVSLDEDMSYVSAPRFNISSKCRQSFGSQPIFEAKSDEGNEKHRSRSEEYLPNAERIDRNEASADVIIECKKTNNEGKDQNISDTFGDVFGTDESSYKDIKIDLKDESKVDISQNIFDLRNDDLKEDRTGTKEKNMSDYLQDIVETRKEDPAVEDQNVLGIVKDKLHIEDKVPYEEVAGSSIELSAEDVCSDEETLDDDDGRLEFSIHEEDTVCRESEVVVESKLEISDENADDVATELDTVEFTQDENETARKVVDSYIDQYSNPKQLSEQDFEIANTDEKRNDSYDDSILNSDTRLARDLFGNVTADNENISGNIVSNNDDNTLSVFARVKNWERRSTEDGFGAGTRKENRKGFDNQDDEIIQDKYEITIDSSENKKEITVLSSAEGVEETGDLSPASNTSFDDTAFINEGLSESGGKDQEVLQTSFDLEMELQGSFEKSDASLDKNSSGDGIQHDFSSDNITMDTSTNLENTEMELQQETYDDTSTNNVNTGEVILNEFSSDNITMETSLKESDVVLQQESYDETTSDNVNSSETMVETSLKESDVELQQESYDDTSNPENEVPRIPAHLEKKRTSFSEDGILYHKSDNELLRDFDIHVDPGISSQDTRSESQTTAKSVNKDPNSPESRIDAMRAFSEAFVTTNAAVKGHELRENRESHEDRGSHEESGQHKDPETPEYSDTYEERDIRDDRGYHADQYALEERESSEITREDRGFQEDRNAREDRGYRQESEGPDSRRSSDLHYGGFHGDNESMISETSGYGTPSVSEDTSSKRTPSISGDEGMNTITEEARRLPSETAPVIVTTEAADDVPRDGNSFRNSSITDFEEDLDVSFSKYGTGLGNRMLKDQLSMGSRESIASYYSNAGGEVYGKYPVSGEILFGIKYDPKIQEFQIQIHQARDITAVEKTQTSDPYVKTYLLPDRSRTGKRKSKVKKNTINPVFDEILTYKITYDEILQRTLWLAVWNHDTFGHNDFLGEVLVPIDQYHQSGFSLEDPEPQWYELCERQPEDNQFSYNGEIVFALKYVPPSAVVSSKKKKKKKKADDEKGELHINIIEATNLIAKDSNGFSDPFCKSYLLPDKSKKSKQKTPVVKKSLNPKWNYHFVYDNVTHEELMDRVLELTIWDFDRGSSNEFLGGVRLGLGTGVQEWDDATSEEQAAWNKMLNNQNDWNQITLTLREHMGHHKSGGFYSPGGRDPDLMEIKPVRPALDPLLACTLSKSPDDQLIRHHEYHSPHESRIAAAIRLSQEKLSSPTTANSPGTKTLTLAELAGLSPKKQEQSSPLTTFNSAAPDSTSRSSVPSSSASPLNAPGTSTPNVTTEESPSLVRHSEFYKGSAVRRPSSEITQGPRERGGSTLSDLIQQGNVDNDSLLGSNLSVNEGWKGSRESIYSNDGVYGDRDVSGEILLSYQYFKGSFKVKIFEARGLTAVDKNTSNPYVKVYLLPDQSRTGKRKTKMKHDTLDPEFNEEMLYKISMADLVRRTIWISVWHYDRFGRNEFLGEVQIPLRDYKGSEVAPNWYPLVPTQFKSGDNEQGGELVVALMYSPADKKRKSGQGAGKLYVKIIEAKNLPGKDEDGLSDPFCKSYLLPDPEKKSKRKTPVKKRNLNPRWDYKFSYDNMTIDDLQHRVLELTVWDHDLGTSNDFIGGVRIGLGTSDKSWDDCTGEEVTLWQFLLSKPNTWAESTLPLRSEMGSRKGLRT